MLVVIQVTRESIMFVIRIDYQICTNKHLFHFTSCFIYVQNTHCSNKFVRIVKMGYEVEIFSLSVNTGINDF